MIRQTITCDTCGIERKQANHWFEAFEHEGELRIRGLISSKTTRPGLKHLCGQTCLHRLVDDFLAGNLKSRMFGIQEEGNAPADFAELARTADSPHDEVALDFESSARLVVTPKSKPVVAARPPKRGKRSSEQRSAKSTPPAPARASEKPLSGASISSNLGKPSPPAAIDAVPVAPTPPAPSAPTPARVGQSLLSGTRRPIGTPNTMPLSMSAPAVAGLGLEPHAPLTPQARRARAWERERSRERLSAKSSQNSSKVQKFL